MVAKRDSVIDRPSYLARAAGSLVILLGAVVLVGWFTGFASLVQLQPQWVPMQFNTALSFILCGTGLLFLAGNRQKMAASCGFFVLGLSVLTLLQYFLDLSLGVDQFFIEPFITTKSAHPGRMAQPTAFEFLLTSIILVLANRAVPLKQFVLICGLLGTVIAAIGAGTLFGYLLGKDTPFNWSHLTYMAVHTAIGFFLLGIGMLALALHKDPSEGRWPNWIAAVIGLGFSTLVLSLWLSLLTYRDIQTEQIVTGEINSLRAEIEISFNQQVLALRRMARRWEHQAGTPLDLWKADATFYLEDNPALKAIAWVDPLLNVQWLESSKSAAGFKKQDFATRSQKLKSMQNARQTHVATATPSVKLSNGGRGIFIYAPLYIGGRFDGFISGVFHIESLLKPIIKASVSENYKLILFEADKEIYHYIDSGTMYESGISSDKKLNILNLDWRLSIQPSQVLMDKRKSPLPFIVLTVGLLLALLMTFTVYFYKIAEGRANKLGFLNKNLTAENFERIRVEKSLEESRLWLQGILNSMKDGVLVATTDLMLVDMNPACQEMFGYVQEEVTGQSMEMLHVDHEHFSTFNQQFAETLNKEEVRKFEFELRRKNGEIFPAEHTLSLLENSEGEAIGIVSSVRDITARKQVEKELRDYREHLKEMVIEQTYELEVSNAELHEVIAKLNLTKETLREREHYLQTMFSNMQEGVITTNENLVIESANPEALAMLGYNVEQMVGQNVEILIPASDIDRHAQSVKPLLEQKRQSVSCGLPIGPREVSALHADGTKFQMSMAVGEMWINGQRKFIAIIKDITERVLAQQALETSQSQLRRLTAHLQDIREDERVRISRDVHDEIGQVLTALNMEAYGLKKATENDNGDIHDKILSLIPLISSAITSVQRITSELRPPMLEQLGLGSAIQWHVESFQARMGIKCILFCDIDNPQLELDRERETAVFRILQEAMTNVARHANATQVSIDLRMIEYHLEMIIADNGQGILPSAISANDAFGLMGMKERALAFDGKIEIEGQVNAGTTVRLYLPLKN